MASAASCVPVEPPLSPLPCDATPHRRRHRPSASQPRGAKERPRGLPTLGREGELLSSASGSGSGSGSSHLGTLEPESLRLPYEEDLVEEILQRPSHLKSPKPRKRRSLAKPRSPKEDILDRTNSLPDGGSRPPRRQEELFKSLPRGAEGGAGSQGTASRSRGSLQNQEQSAELLRPLGGGSSSSDVVEELLEFYETSCVTPRAKGGVPGERLEGTASEVLELYDSVYGCTSRGIALPKPRMSMSVGRKVKDADPRGKCSAELDTASRASCPGGQPQHDSLAEATEMSEGEECAFNFGKCERVTTASKPVVHKQTKHESPYLARAGLADTDSYSGRKIGQLAHQERVDDLYSDHEFDDVNGAPAHEGFPSSDYDTTEELYDIEEDTEILDAGAGSVHQPLPQASKMQARGSEEPLLRFALYNSRRLAEGK